MFLPVAVILGFILWGLITLAKRRVMDANAKKWEMDPKKFEEFMNHPIGKSKKTPQEHLENVRRQRQAEEMKKIKACFGKTIFEEIEERRKKQNQRQPRQFDPSMFEDSVSRLHAEIQKKKASFPTDPLDNKEN